MSKSSYVLVVSLLLATGCDRSDDNLQERADSLFDRAVQYVDHGRYDEAEAAFTQLLRADQELGRLNRVARHLLYLGIISKSRGEFEEASGFFEQSESTARRGMERKTEIESMLANAQLAGTLGEIGQQFQMYEDALANTRFFPYPEGEFLISIDLGKYYIDTGRSDLAKKQFLNAYRIATELDNAAMKYRIALTKGSLFIRQRLFPEAEYYLDLAENLRPYIYDPAEQLKVILLYGQKLEAKGDYVNALETYKDGLNLYRDIPPNKPEFLVLIESVAHVKIQLLNYREAAQYYEIIVDLTERFDYQISHGFALLGLSDSYYKIGKELEDEVYIERAIVKSDEAENHFNNLGYNRGTAYALYHRGRILSEIGNSNAAVELFRRSHSALDNVRDFSKSISSQTRYEERNALVDPYYSITQYLIDELISLDRLDEAFLYSEKVRQKYLNDKVMRAGITLSANENSRSDNLTTELFIKRKFLERARALTLEHYEQYMSKRKRLESIIEEANYEWGVAGDLISNKLTNGGMLFDNRVADVRSIQRVIRPGRTLLSYFPTAQNMHVFILRRGVFQVVSIPVSFEEMIWQSDNFMRAVSSPAVFHAEDGGSIEEIGKYKQLETQIYKLFIEPVETHISGSEHLIFIPPPGMEYIPLHAIGIADQERKYMPEQFRTSYLPSATVLTFSMTPDSRIGDITAFGNPTGRSWDIEYEIRDIRGIFHQTTINLAANATIENLLKAGGDVLHIATEFYYQPGYPENSYFLMAMDGTLSVGQVPAGKLSELQQFNSVFLANTGSVVEGLNIMHPYIFFINGTRNVSVNYWVREPRSAKWFNENVYSNLSLQIPFVEAFHQAQLTLISTPQYSHPHFWAQFFVYSP